MGGGGGGGRGGGGGAGGAGAPPPYARPGSLGGGPGKGPGAPAEGGVGAGTGAGGSVAFHRSCDVRAMVRVRVRGVRGDLMVGAGGAAAASLGSSGGGWAQELVRGASGGSPQAQVEVSLRGNEGRLGVPQRTRAFDFQSGTSSGSGQNAPSAVGDWVRTCVRVCDLSGDAALHFRVWVVGDGRGTRVAAEGELKLFSGRGRLQLGTHKVLLELTGLSEPMPSYEEATATMRKWDGLVKRYNRGDLQGAPWLDDLSLARLQGLQAAAESAAMEAGAVFLTVELPASANPVLFHERTGVTAADALSLSAARDPEVGKENPAERKAAKLSRAEDMAGRGSRAGGRGGGDFIKPNIEERKEISALLRQPPTRGLGQRDRRLLWRFRRALQDEPAALTKFLRSIHWEDVDEVREATSLIASWAPIGAGDALSLLSPDFPDSNVREFAVQVLGKAEDSEIMDYLLQLVQALRYETSDTSALSEFLIERACRNPVLANFFHWYLYVEWQDPNFGIRFANIHHRFVEKLLLLPIGYEVWDSISRQIELMAQLGAIKRELRAVKGNSVKQAKALRELLSETGVMGELSSLQLPLPLDPSICLTGILREECAVFKSALLPLKLTFKTSLRDLHGTDAEKNTPEMHNRRVSVAGAAPSHTYSVIFKKGDDLRQDQLILQMVRIMDRLLKRDGLDLRMTPYNALATSAGKDVSDASGLLECVPNCFPLSNIIEKFRDIRTFFAQYNPDPLSPMGFYPDVLESFVKSCAGYCVVTYILGVGDRHLDNLMLCRDGRLFHIDFGYILGKDPKPFPAPMRIVKEMIEAMGGVNGEPYRMFQRYCCEAYNILRKSVNLFLSLFNLMIGARIPDMMNDYEKCMLFLEERFRLDLSDELAVHHIQQVINDSASAVMPQVIEAAHRIAQAFR